jgi:hypothetical protein
MTAIETIKNGVHFGPFKTEHHRKVVDKIFQDHFFNYMELEILPKVEGQFDRVEGRVWSHYDDTKFFGPLSLLKFRYYFEISFHSGISKEIARGEVNYDKDHGTFTGTSKSPPHVDSLSHQKKRLEMMDQVKSIVQRCRDGERDIKCPNCNAPLSIWMIGEMVKDIRCPNHCIRTHFD